MSEKNISFSNIVSTPTLSSWAQAYNAGKLFAVLSLKGELAEATGDDQGLGAIGKKILNNLEQEFFTLETKDLRAIKSAIEITAQKIPENIESSFVVSAIVNNIAYLFVLNKGRVNLKREDKLGTIIDGEKDDDKLKASSGFLKDNDIIILQTDQFTDLVSEDRLSSSLDHQKPEEISEILAPYIHEAEEGGAAAVIIEYKEEKETFEEDKIKETEYVEDVVGDKEEIKEQTLAEEAEEQKEEIEIPYRQKSSYFSNLKEKVKMPRLRIAHSKKIYLTIAVIILIVLVTSIFLAYKNQQDAKVKATFAQYYSPAEKKYEEGQALIDLNQGLARDSFLSSQKTLNEAKTKLPKGSGQEKQVLELLAKVESALQETSGIETSNAKEVSLNESTLLSFEKNHSGSYFFEAERNIYYIDDKGVNVSDGTTSKTIITNNSDWDTPGGLSLYFGNIYVLDKKDGILKFVSESYDKSQYFSGTSPNLEKASSIAIDGSIWILFSDGTISKFTKGTADSFNVSGLETKLLNPTRIYTNLDSNNVYILDNGNSRIVVLGKDGGYKAQYQSGVLKQAKDFDVKETLKQIFVLSGGKLYQIDLK
ncbi:MAG: hypothetical protein A2152_00040 [Candidatus Levybacteria bacterium RBG_16_35_6]|nr:MAG: hypothetical protein A2152_00040 [Candidatus Levybacteria bacterium RBG_16_35_6]